MGLDLEAFSHHNLSEHEKPLKKQGELIFLQKKAKKMLVVTTAALTLIGVGKLASEHSFESETVLAHVQPDIDFAKNKLVPGAGRYGLSVKSESSFPISFVTFNTASGNPTIKTPQSEFIQLSFYQKAINGDSDAPIIGLQEAGPAQVEAVQKIAKKNGNFSYIYHRSRFSDGGNFLIIPKRFEVLESKSVSFSPEAQMKGTVNAVLTNSLEASQIFPRAFTQATLKDRDSDRIFTVFNTHLSYDEAIQEAQEDELFKVIEKTNGNVVLLGDLNANAHLQNPHGKRLKKNIETAGLIDMGPLYPPKKRGNIDHVLARGFHSVKQDYLFDIHLPGSPTAEQVSDHYAEKDELQFDS